MQEGIRVPGNLRAVPGAVSIGLLVQARFATVAGDKPCQFHLLGDREPVTPSARR
ncbi:MAG: hypothetical protein K6U87_08145 [Firmicutes bacterium]|nr:hypothetical protein [Bacillota bacterium]